MLRWNGGERLILLFVLLSMKSQSLFDKRCLVSFGIGMLLNYVADLTYLPGVRLLVEMLILVVGLSNYHHATGCVSPKRNTVSSLSLVQYLADHGWPIPSIPPRKRR